ncbi:MAG: ABC transporter substrate-binding protein [Pseudomonadales bacterium]|nr:ABC transporter substrate-binding protein [Pseudomonadales bacterium]
MNKHIARFVLSIFAIFSISSAYSANAQHGLAIHGDTHYPANFTHFDYVNPDAPKGGEIIINAVSSGGFDSLNPYILKGEAANGIQEYLYETLATMSSDEAFSHYGRVAESMEVAEDRSWIIFNLNKQARFHDGHAITAEDVVFSFNTLLEKGHPSYASYYRDVEKVEALSKHRVKYSFKVKNNRELPLIVGNTPVLPAHYWKDKKFDQTSLTPPLGSGPYKITHVDPGHTITFERVKDYWGKNLPVNRGRYNFDKITIDYYRDNTIALQAFKSGEYHYRTENTSRNWATSYTGKNFDNGHIIKREIRHQLPTGMQGFVYNTRRPLFQDAKVRQALDYAFDFEWTNKQLFYGAYTRTNSYFSNSELAASGLPSPEELAILQPFKGKIPEEVFTTPYKAPTTDGSGNIRSSIRNALRLLKQAGWQIKDKKLVNNKGEPFAFTILIVSPDFKRIVLPFKRNLARLGIDVSIQLVDTQQYINRVQSFDFDMTVTVFGQSLSPGNEQHNYWHSSTADQKGSRNWIGIKNPVIDALVEGVIAAPDRESLIYRTRALDRVLLWNHYVIPHWHIRNFRVAYWNIFSQPSIQPLYDLGFDNWWVDPDKNAKFRPHK